MRSSRHALYLRALSRGSAIVLFGGVLTACSNDMSRLGDVMTTGSVVSDNQRQLINKNQETPQSYPVDQPAQSTPNSSYDDGIKVSKPQPLAPAVVSSPLPSSSGITVTKRRYSAPAVPAMDDGGASYTPPPVAKTVVESPERTERVASVAPARKNAIVLAPRTQGKTKLTIVGTDRFSTGSIARPAPKLTEVKKAGSKAVGWKGAGGSTVTVKSGETLYNLSRRYGVPVDAIMKANGLTSSSDLTAGKKIQIPAYTYDKSARVSAPDSNPMTKASRATTGFNGQVRNGKVAVPNKREPVKAPAPRVIARTVDGGGGYIVSSGDTLYSIARRHGVSARALSAANGLSGNNIRLGQKLSIPSGGAKIIEVKQAVRTAQPVLETVEPTTTGSVPNRTETERAVTTQKRAATSAPAKTETVTIAKRSTEKVKTPSKTTSGSFRWPTNGRVITKFGERVNGTSNDGIDISVPVGTPVKATENGTVIYSGSELADFGNLILVSHQGGWVSAYAHASVNKVKRGDKVRRGQVIAMSGKTGNATRPKLHFELRKDSTPVNPLKHLAR